MFEAIFRQKSDASYKASIRVKNFLLDDLRVTNKAGSVTRMMDRHFTLDPSAHMLVVSFEFKPKNTSRKVVVRQRKIEFFSSFNQTFSLLFVFSQRQTRKSLFLHQFGLFNGFTRFFHLNRTETGDHDRNRNAHQR